MKSLDTKELKEILHKNWMTHDGMWFYHCLQECGIEKTNRINRAAVRSMAMIEMKRMAKALGIMEVNNFERFKDLMEGAYGIVKADFMKFNYAFPGKDMLRMDMIGCFAHDGMARIGVIHQYQCGIFERIKGWFDALGVGYTEYPEVEGCMMHSEGRCYREFRLHFPVNAGGGASL
jgi:hypothetical protein